jgi:AhpD family alkylhydroperoxidase
MNPTPTPTPPPGSTPDSVREEVRKGYAEIAVKTPSCGCSGVSCCGSSPEDAAALVKQIGYSAEEIASLPEGANMGLSCGNPTALASLREGEVVLDLGAGGGFDVFIAARKVGPRGKAIGVDMTPEMVAKARRNKAVNATRLGWDNVDFRLGEIEHLPIADSSVDVIISNCVLNLSPDKASVWREMYRVLKPGGRVAISDLALLKPLPQGVREMIEALVGCVAGAVLVSETEQFAREAGLAAIVLKTKDDYVRAMTDWHDPLYQKILAQLPQGASAADYLTSLEITGIKPPAPSLSLQTPAITELVAIGAAIAANCEPCFKYHFNQARKLGVSMTDIAAAIQTAQSVKQAPAQSIARLAERILHGIDQPEPESACCPGEKTPAHSACCGR